MSRTIKMQMSADVDRFSDAKLLREYCPCLRDEDGKHPTPGELRMACADARFRGYEVLPICDTPNEKGWCRCEAHGTAEPATVGGAATSG